MATGAPGIHPSSFHFLFAAFPIPSNSTSPEFNCYMRVEYTVSFKSREDHRKQLELEEARKAGLVPAELDEDGKEINPHIPQYMSSAPWYLNAQRPVTILLLLLLIIIIIIIIILVQVEWYVLVSKLNTTILCDCYRV
jgi:hypothetical protein